MAEKHLSEAAWKAFAKGRDYKDAALLKALAEFDKAERGTPEAQNDALDAIEKQADALAKANKSDKELSAYLADVDKALGRARKAAAQAAKEAEAEEDEEESSPALLTSKMLPLLRQVRAGNAKFAMVASTGKETAVLLARKAIGPARRKLLAEYLDASGGVKYFVGECLLENNAVTFVLQAQVGGLAKKLKVALENQTGMKVKVRCRGNEGDSDDDGEPDEPGSGSTTPGAEAPSPAEQSYTTRRAALDPRIDEALKAKHPESTKLRALAGFASDKAAGGDFKAALQSLDMLDKLLGTAGGGKPGDDNAALNEALQAWKRAREDILGRLKVELSELAEDLAEEPDNALFLDAELQLNAVMRQLSAEPRTAEQVRSLTVWLADDEVVADVDAHVGNVRAPLTEALASLQRALG